MLKIENQENRIKQLIFHEAKLTEIGKNYNLKFEEDASDYTERFKKAAKLQNNILIVKKSELNK
jgi:hypothetical protein